MVSNILPNTNNLYDAVLLQVFLSNTNDIQSNLLDQQMRPKQIILFQTRVEMVVMSTKESHHSPYPSI